ncbi:Reverse transcriptase domain-containing protein [Aphis craccivora]|uniref:Reverse transcriptase domain-containing protein n=1 Tax=Aphis craccivora TaxID=307492 RepID=A0A6G0X7U2_APHCR|nr:Reverse transcriptase domain-containing protein [Aphis craccivora]
MNDLRILYWNSNGIKSKINELHTRDKNQRNYQIQISATYKSPNKPLIIKDLNVLTNGNHWFVISR